jgi:hypothetical protein
LLHVLFLELLKRLRQLRTHLNFRNCACEICIGLECRVFNPELCDNLRALLDR